MVTTKKVLAHAGRQRDRVAANEPHQDRCKGSGQARRGCDGGEVHPRGSARERSAQHGWLNEDDVRHRQEGGRAGEHLRANRRARFLNPKESFEHRPWIATRLGTVAILPKLDRAAGLERAD